MCDIFKVATDIYAERENDAYRIYLKTEGGLITTVKHVGFGISQMLPIVVQGLISDKGTLIFEQPEIHLHPKLQSTLFDFLYSLTLLEKYVIIETHSDHFITRMRRRIAEDLNNTLTPNINLTFIENKNGQNMFRSVDLDDFGSYSYFPTDFIEQSNIELKSIVKAQMRKRLNKK
jgi:predicted ATPase